MKPLKLTGWVWVLLPALLAWALSGQAADVNAKQTAKLRHVVAFKFKEDAKKEQIQQIEKAFRDLKKKIPTVAGYEWGTNVSPEKKEKGFTHCFVLTFKNEADRDTYLNHDEHKAFAKLAQDIVADVFVIDFWSQK